MNARLLDVLHDRTDHDCLAVADAIDIHLGRVFEKVIDEDRIRRAAGSRAGARLDRLAHVAAQVGFVVDKLHPAPAEDERWSY